MYSFPCLEQTWKKILWYMLMVIHDKVKSEWTRTALQWQVCNPHFISFHFISLLCNDQWLMSACGDITELEMTEGKLLKDEDQFLVQPEWCVRLAKVICAWSLGARWTWTNEVKRSAWRVWVKVCKEVIPKDVGDVHLMLEHDWDRSNVGKAFHRCTTLLK